MEKELFKIVFDGEIAYGYTREEVQENLRQFCRFEQAYVERLFSGGTFTLKKNLDVATANRYKDALDRTGARCSVVSMAEPQAPPEPVPPPFTCPACGHPQEKGESCTGCGIFFAKYERAQALKAHQEGGGGAPSPFPNDTPHETLPPDADFADRLEAYFARHQEQAFILKSFFMIVAIIFLRQFLTGGLLILMFFLFPVGFLLYVRLHASTSGEDPNQVLAQHITFMPVMYAEGERKKEGAAWATYSIIALNIFIFYGIELHVDPEFIFSNFLFLPESPNMWNVPVSAFTAIFLHAGGGHLWGNMIFLWAVGTVVEKRIGWGRFLALYLVTGLFAGFFGVVTHRTFFGATLHGLGASGAISGVLGIFAVRCYFKSMVFPVPILGIFSLILPVSLKVRLNSLVIIGLFFLADLSGGVAQINGTSASMVGHWVHIGGMISGILLAMMLKLGEDAIDERHMEIGSQAVSGKKGSLGMGEESLRIALQRNPENAEALLLLARIQSKYTQTDEGRDFFCRAITILSKERPQEAADTFREYFTKYMKGVESEVHARLAPIFHRQGDLDMASQCLELVANDAGAPPSMREKAIFQCGRILEEMGLPDAARGWYSRFIEEFPDSPNRAKIESLISAA